MKQVYDIMTDEDNDLQIAGGDWVVDESTAQHQKALIVDSKGDWKQQPTVGVGAFRFLNDEGSGGLLQEVSMQFIKDGMTIVGVGIDAFGTLRADAHY
ncbi:oxidase [bacterium]|nr:oxidase [bacterium]